MTKRRKANDFIDQLGHPVIAFFKFNGQMSQRLFFLIGEGVTQGKGEHRRTEPAGKVLGMLFTKKFLQFLHAMDRRAASFRFIEDLQYASLNLLVGCEAQYFVPDLAGCVVGLHGDAPRVDVAMAVEANPLAVYGQPFLGRQPGGVRILLVKFAQCRDFGRRIPGRVSEEATAQPDAPVHRMGIFAVAMCEQKGCLS